MAIYGIRHRISESEASRRCFRFSLFRAHRASFSVFGISNAETQQRNSSRGLLLFSAWFAYLNLKHILDCTIHYRTFFACKTRLVDKAMACVTIDAAVGRLIQNLVAYRSSIACHSTCLKELSSARATRDTTATSVSREHDTWSHQFRSHHRGTKPVAHSHRYQIPRIRMLQHTSASSKMSAVAPESACARGLRTCDDQHHSSSPLHGRAPVGLRHCVAYKADFLQWWEE